MKIKLILSSLFAAALLTGCSGGGDADPTPDPTKGKENTSEEAKAAKTAPEMQGQFPRPGAKKGGGAPPPGGN